MKYCKGNCGRRLGLLEGDYCEYCFNRLPLREKIIEESKQKTGDEE